MGGITAGVTSSINNQVEASTKLQRMQNEIKNFMYSASKANLDGTPLSQHIPDYLQSRATDYVQSKADEAGQYLKSKTAEALGISDVAKLNKRYGLGRYASSSDW